MNKGKGIAATAEEIARARAFVRTHGRVPLIEVPPIAPVNGGELAAASKRPKTWKDGLITACAADTEMAGVDWLWPDRFALGKIGLIAGLPDMGKGQIGAFLAAAVTNSDIKLPCDEGVAPQGNVIWFNAEDDA